MKMTIHSYLLKGAAYSFLAIKLKEKPESKGHTSNLEEITLELNYRVLHKAEISKVREIDRRDYSEEIYQIKDGKIAIVAGTFNHLKNWSCPDTGN